MRRALIALVVLAFVATGVAMATPVPVLAVRGDQRQYLAVLAAGDGFLYSYEQSIYGGTVTEHFARDGDRLRLRRVFSQDIRSIEYFRWETPINRDGIHYVAEPPPTVVPELVIRITPAGRQHMTGLNGDWRVYLLDRFGEGVVRVSAERAPLGVALAQGLHW